MVHPTITLSIEPIEGRAFQHGYHLGTDLAVARRFAEEIFQMRNQSELVKDHNDRVMKTRTVALMRGGEIIDCYDGQWSSDWEPTP